jgi:CTP synthase
VEISELADHPFMLGSQFHPEFKSRPNRPHPLFQAFLKAAIAYEDEHKQRNGKIKNNLNGHALVTETTAETKEAV